MKSAKIFIVFTFILAFAVCISAQDEKPKIVWKNLREKYERFEDIAPTVFNENNFSVFIPQSFPRAIGDGFVRLMKLDEKKNEWTPNYIWICGTMTKKERKEMFRNIAAYKLISNAERRIELDELAWFDLTKSYVDSGFTELAGYNGKGKYKFQIPFTKGSESFISESPEFEVIEKDFKK